MYRSPNDALGIFLAAVGRDILSRNASDLTQRANGKSLIGHEAANHPPALRQIADVRVAGNSEHVPFNVPSQRDR